MKVTIRNFHPEDMEKILHFREETGRISFPGKRLDKEKEGKTILRHIEKFPGTLKVAEAGGKPIGFIRFQPRSGTFGKYGYINIIFVEKSQRNKGTGKLLLEASERWFRSRGIESIRATITNTNIRSLEFFKKLGYREKRTVVEKTPI